LWDPKTIRKNALKKEREGKKGRFHFLRAICVLIGLGKAGVAPQLQCGNPKALIGASAEMPICESFHCNSIIMRGQLAFTHELQLYEKICRCDIEQCFLEEASTNKNTSKDGRRS
jgi:hypothetical protein